ncbi:hypothetical protein Tco_0111404 [Tanacetum coccineum]
MNNVAQSQAYRLANALATTYQALAENSLLEKTEDMRMFMNWYCQNMGNYKLTQADLEGQAYEVVKPFYSDIVHLQFQMEECHKMLTDQIDWANPEGDQVRIDISKPLPLSGLLGHVTIQTQLFFNKDLDYLRYGSKGSGQALLISKIKAARYHDFGLELLVPEHMWINDVCTYDISASYGISHWWFNSQKFYIDRHIAESSHKITLHIADHQEYTIAEKDFKNLYPSDFEDLNLLLLQGYLNHLPGLDIRMLSTAIKLWIRNLVIRKRVKDFQLGIESYQKQLNLTKLGWDATGFEFKHDYTIINSPRAVVFHVNNNERKIIRFNEIYKFSDGTLTNIMETLDYRVKEYKVNRLNPVDIEKMAVRSSLRSLRPKRTIESRAKRSSINLIKTLFHITCSSHNVKTRVIIRVLHIILVVLPENSSDTYVFTMKMEILLESTSNKLMVGDSDVHTLEDPTLILEILSRRFFLRLNLPDHSSVQVKMEMEIPRSSGVYFITACSYSTDTSNDLMKAQIYVSKLPQLYYQSPLEMSQAQDGERPQVDDQRLDFADDLKEAQVHISSLITSHKTKVIKPNVTTELTNIKEAMLDHNWIESMQDKLNQFKRLDVWELPERPIDGNIIKVKWLWKNKTNAENTIIQNKSRLVAKGYSQ